MPVISVTLLPGYSSEAESRLVQRVAVAARSVIAAAAAGISILLWAVVLVVELSRLYRAWLG